MSILNTPYQKNYLFLDVETTGLLPKNYRSGFSNPTWPKIVQAAWVLADEKGKIIKSVNKIVAVDVLIPDEVVAIHGITNEIAQTQGVPLGDVLDELLQDFKQSDVLICHNVNFDLNVLRGELLRKGHWGASYKFKTFCTMLESIRYCDIEHPYYTRKWPSLSELYYECFKKNLRKAHDASSDVKAVHKIFFHLKKKKVFEISERHNFFRTLGLYQQRQEGCV